MVLSILPPAPKLTDLQEFAAAPLLWLQEWNEQNGRVEHEKTPDGFVVRLWVDGLTEQPLSTGVAPNLTHAFQNAIKGLEDLAMLR